jgi:regulator of sigma E protease
VKIEVARDGAEPATLSVVPREVNWIEEPRWPASPVAISSLGLAVAVETTIAAVEPGSPAEAAGVKAGEKVIRAQFIEPGEAANPEDAGLELSDRFVVDRGLVFKPVYKLVKAGSVGAALASGGRKAIEDLSLVYRFLGKLTSSQISPRLLGGPIEIAKQAGRSAEEGFSRLLLFLTMLSANLAVVNFLPIPVLDGGHMVFLLYELVRGKPPSENVVAALSYLGLALILTLMMFVFGLDLGFIPRR